MIRIQIEKVLPFSAEEVTTDFEVIEQNENESVVSAVAIRNEQLAEIAPSDAISLPSIAPHATLVLHDGAYLRNVKPQAHAQREQRKNDDSRQQ